MKRYWQTIEYLIVRLGLWPRMAFGISAGFLVVLIAFSLLGDRALQDTATHITEERQVIALMAASQIDALLGRVVDALQMSLPTTDSAGLDSLGSLSDQDLAEIHERLADLARGVVLLDDQGRLLAAFPPNLVITEQWGITVIQRESSGGLAIPIAADETIGHDALLVAIPLRSAEGIRGYIGALIDPTVAPLVDTLAEAARIGRTGHAILTDEGGRVLASTLDLAFLSPAEHASFYRQAVEAGTVTVKPVPFEMEAQGEPLGHLHLMAFAPLRRASWGVAVGGDLDETFAGVRRLRIGLIALGGLTLLGVWGATLLGTRWLVLPVQRLTAAAERIAGGDVHTPLQAPEGGEIGSMAVALERMRTQLLASIEELGRWNEVLESRVEERTAELRRQEALARQLLRRSIAAQEEERGRLARELHDEMGQLLTAIQLGLDHCSRSLDPLDGTTQRRLQRVQTLTVQALTELRRVINALRPGILDRLGLVPALEWVADHVLRPFGVTVAIDAVQLSGRLPEELETILFRIAQEALSNVVRHSHATHVDIQLQSTNQQATMVIRDNGEGFRVSAVVAQSDGGRGLGLAGMRERASLANGQVRIESVLDQGTTITVILPRSPSRKRAEARQAEQVPGNLPGTGFS